MLIGAETWSRRWVRYEIARAIIDGRGLVGVHLNSIRRHQTLTAHTKGYNPLDAMAVGKVQPNVWSPVAYYLFEIKSRPDGYGGLKWEWQRYQDYTSAVTKPTWLPDCLPGHITQLSANSMTYDHIADDGHKNIGGWIDRAAVAAGR